MKYVITGSLGHISKPLTIALLKAGHEVAVITSNAARTKEIEALGATALVGSVTDTAFLSKAFAGAGAVYTMVPPNYAATDFKGYIGQVGQHYADAIRANPSIKYVVNLSSVGAHLPSGVGPVSGLYRAEQALNAVPGIHIKHLRPSYFYYNLYSMIPIIKHMDIIGSNFSVAPGKFPLVDPTDIATVAAQELLQLNFTGQSFRYIASDETDTASIAATLGKAIGKPALQWVQFTDEQALGGMLQAGLPEDIAKNYVEMGQAIQSGSMFED
ncbi:MAG TPA: NmrA family NAD(P)-binding protein, partial [Chitinophagaceae bacterium]|nr:NmrA family NAD(P)-binding protein [Chitinophagaceae bacterium]